MRVDYEAMKNVLFYHFGLDAKAIIADLKETEKLWLHKSEGEIEWPSSPEYLKNPSDYEQGRADGEERMLAKCRAAVERAGKIEKIGYDELLEPIFSEALKRYGFEPNKILIEELCMIHYGYKAARSGVEWAGGKQ